MTSISSDFQSFVLTSATGSDLELLRREANRSSTPARQLSENLSHIRLEILNNHERIRHTAPTRIDGLAVNIDNQAMLADVQLSHIDGQQVAEFRVWNGLYVDVLLPHPGIHPVVSELLDPFVRGAASLLAERTGRSGVPADLEQVRAGLAHSWAESHAGRPVACGVSALITAENNGELFGLITRRSEFVAINPSVLTTPIDGGLTTRKEAWKQVWDEANDELRGASQISDLLEDQKTDALVGILVPGTVPLSFSSDVEIKQAGLNALYHLRANSFEHLEAIRVHAEVGMKDGGFVEGTPEIVALDRLLMQRDEPVSEPLIALVDLALNEADSGIRTLSIPINIQSNETATGMIEDTKTQDTGSGSAGNTNQRFAEALIRRFPHLNNTASGLQDYEERFGNSTGDVPLEAQLVERAEACAGLLIEFTLVPDEEFDYFDPGRVYEAIVYQAHRYLFNGTQGLGAAKQLVSKYASTSTDDAFDSRLLAQKYSNVKTREREGKDRSYGDLSAHHPALLRRDYLARALADELTETEAEALRAGIHRLAFCCTIVQMESENSPDAAAYVLHGDNRLPLTGDPMSLFFKSRGMFISPVLSGAQLQTGFQFALSALDRFPGQAGFHNNVAQFEMRLAKNTADEDSRVTLLKSALNRIDRALELDPEVSLLYETRANVKIRLERPLDARLDVEAAIELERYAGKTTSTDEERLYELTKLLNSIT